MVAKPKARWYQFSLRTMLIVMVLASAAFGYWVHWSKEWIRQRHEALAQKVMIEPYVFASNIAPGGLWVFSEKGAVMIYCRTEDAGLAASLFPEAKIIANMNAP